ncbi:glycine betaine/L-proline ABC transporter ATP-binding protein [Caldibacillus thermoamylovorans]|uniref:quaternary amine ABC transporter ATP-binding protein n=1 Tax=Caldibacillus thermoamylovorans TaxID=35841 RepID=UPI001D05E4E6|nr:glycine betaine/L-proline ABC transporter ATP-binding protein [Caldibacillus thermoamylovorans]MCB5933851.1 glycine betaine/L-proline ABC transporter ATP-binding protein [Bacillus sp. DFI.2.34]MCB7077129.1 glycine betaine/L-proline ABC transporter ATP-binding protein [Caldibacillus thermoamylovorans]
MNEAKIKVQNVTKVFGKSPKQGLEMLNNGMSKKDILEKTGMTIGVNRANFEVYPGEIFVIMGLSGSGKSTLVRMINRLIEPTTGQVLIDNQDIVKLNANELREVRRKKLGMVFQQFALFPHRTVLGNVQYGLEIRGADKGLKTAKAMEALRQVGLEGYENSFPSELSGGMQQRVGLARALANDPDILLMDEAFSALDPLIRKDMQNELLNLQDSMKKTIVFITHDLDEALRIGDRIALMKDGEIVQIGTAEEILTKPANEYVERFVEDVDFSKVLTAGHIMKRPEHIRHDRGPRVALQIMRDAGISSVYIVDKTQTLLGAITAQAASEAVKDGKSLLEAMSRDIQTVTPETLIVDVLEKTATATLPVAVVDNGNHLKGIIVRGAVLAALAGEGIHLEGKEEK